MNKKTITKLAVSGLFIALEVILCSVSFPVGASKCAPIQHMGNVLAAVLLGPGYGVAIAFCTSVIRNLMGTGTLLAFPGSMVGAFCCGLMFHFTKKLIPTYIAEIFGTGVLGGMLSFPIAALVMGKDAALFTYVVPFLVSTVGGTIIAAVLIAVFTKTGTLDYMRKVVNGEA
jgi:energy coupling factor transporter S component ThiW